MTERILSFSKKDVRCIFDISLENALETYDQSKIIIITDDHIGDLHENRFAAYPVIRVRAGEEHKTQASVDKVIDELLKKEADKQTIIVGVGGGVVTDMAGYVASIFKRGARLVQVPTSILGMVDAAVGGKNGVDVGMYKNMVGTVYQPDMVVFDFSFLDTLPKAEWINGFAEIIKHACIKDVELFEYLEQKDLELFMSNRALLVDLVERNVQIKSNIVLHDEFETGDRKLLNFGHTLGHAIENLHQLPHGHAISIGMIAASKISEEINMLDSLSALRIKKLLEQYGLTVELKIDIDGIWNLLLMDKKRDKSSMNFILLDSIGDAVTRSIPLIQLKGLLQQTV